MAHINPVREITAKARAAGVLTVVDGVAWAPHGLPDIPVLGADVYLFSLYKTYGPHQGVMVIRRSLAERFGNEGHYFNAHDAFKRLAPAQRYPPARPRPGAAACCDSVLCAEVP